MTASIVITSAEPGSLDPGAAEGLAGRAREILRSPRLVVGLCIVGFFILLGVVGPFFVQDPNAISTAIYSPPSAAHWLGTTSIGQDVLAQLVVSARASLAIGIGAGLLATVISIVIGIAGGYAGGLVDEALSLLSNVVLVIPTLPLVIVILAYTKASSLSSLIVIIALTSWAASARVLRAQTLSVRNREYILAARASGERAWRIIFVEILPTELPVIVSNLLFSMIFAILTQATFAFIGLGDPTLLTWGNMLNIAYNAEALSSNAWWWFIPPGACIALFGMGLALINFSLDAVLNPRLRVYRARKPRGGQPVASQPVASQPVASQPATSQPTAGQAATSQPTAGQPTAGQA